MTAKHKCCGRVWGGHSFHSCTVNAKFEIEGKWYCGTHNPESVARRNEAKRVVLQAENERRTAENQRAVGAATERKRRVDCYDLMLAALQAILPFIPKSSESEGGAAKYSEAVKAADLIRAAIAKAEGN